MRYSEQPLQTFRLRNFKAVRDSGVIKFTPLTIFIGNNGSGKSSIIEGLETYEIIESDGLDLALNRLGGWENIAYKTPRRPRTTAEGRLSQTHRIEFFLTGKSQRQEIFIGASPDGKEVFIEREWESNHKEVTVRDSKGFHKTQYRKTDDIRQFSPIHRLNIPCEDGESFLIPLWGWHKGNVGTAQFLRTNPEKMGQPQAIKRGRRTVRLESDASNIGDFLRQIREQDEDAFEGIIETLRYVLPYATNIEPVITSELQRTIFLQLSEKDFKVPGWLLSTGTLRILAILAVLRHPSPPPILFIEEIENGLDPRTQNLIVEEIHRATQSGKTQVVCTTHSPYFLDLVPLSSIIVVERDESGQPTFTRPNEKALGDWASKFAPGQLYTMSQLTRS